MENKLSTFLGASLLLCSANAVQASLIDTGSGLIFDDSLNISWLQDANLSATNNFGVSGIAADGTMNWETAFKWINALNDNSYLGYNSWRLPTVTPVNDANFVYDVSYDGSTDRGFNNATGSNELSSLYYEGLGNNGYCSSTTVNGTPSDFCDVTAGPWGLLNTGTFENLLGTRYWTGVENDQNTLRAFDMDFTFGQTGTGGKDGGKLVLAVLEGKPLVVPVPAAFGLFATGLIGLFGVSRRNKQ